MKAIIIIISIGLSVTFFSCKDNGKSAVLKTKELAEDNSADIKAVNNVMKTYKDAIQNLTTNGTLELFTKDATVFESGGSEGTYANYLSHHLGPELKHFNSFIFSDYLIKTKVDLPFAFVTETYIYTINLKENEEKGIKQRIIKKKGVATTDLKKIEGKWKIIKTHSSSRNIRPNSH